RIHRPGRFAAPALAAAAALLAAAGCAEVAGGGGGGGNGAVRVLWRRALEEPAFGFGVPATDGERVFAPFKGVSAYDARDGRLLWRKPLAAYAPRNLVHRDGRVYAAESVVFAFDAETGRELWRFAPDSSADYAHAAADDRALYVGTRDHRVTALRTGDGAVLWSTDLGPEWPLAGLVGGIAVSGDTVYATAERHHSANGFLSSGYLVALDRGTGRVLWTYRNGDGTDPRALTSAPTVAGRLVLASDRKGNTVVAVDRFTGREAWRLEGARGFIGFTMPPAVAEGTAYASSGDRHVYAVRLEDGALAWKTETPAANDYFALCGERVLANYQGVAVIDRRTGRRLQQLLDDDSDFVSSPFAVAGGRAFVLGNRAMYALDCGR
ncbi:MAG TPA: PQQ-binding-like beta-propeller repeat protein, partial [Longimicrobiaceae bacterium]|nr:PQQ-binding-like beta-propeller repeat protein [Longimicrobiaceae bacterium]